MINRAKLFDLLKSNNHCVLSTLHQDGSPESAYVGYTEMPDLAFIIRTLSQSRKATNIQHDERVSMVVGWDEGVTIQVEGCAKVLSPSEVVFHRESLIAKHPRIAKTFSDPDNVYLMIKPSWMRYTDIKVHPWDVQEEKFV